MSAWEKASLPQGKPPHGTWPRTDSITTHIAGTLRTHRGPRSSRGSTPPATAQKDAHNRLSSSQASGPRTRIQPSSTPKNTIPAANPMAEPRRADTSRNAATTRAKAGAANHPPSHEYGGKDAARTTAPPRASTNRLTPATGPRGRAGTGISTATGTARVVIASFSPTPTIPADRRAGPCVGAHR